MLIEPRQCSVFSVQRYCAREERQVMPGHTCLILPIGRSLDLHVKTASPAEGAQMSINKREKN